MTSYTMELPETPEPQFEGDGFVRVGDYIFYVDDDFDAVLRNEAGFVAAALAAKALVAISHPRRQRVEKVSEIARQAAADSQGEPVFAAIAEAIIDALDRGAV